MDDLQDALAGQRRLRLHADRFVVAWNGVLALTFRGFPRGVSDVKATIAKRLSLPGENPGSRWPKVTLGACADGVTLSYEEMCRLQDLCESFSARLQAMASVDIHTLSFVRFACRSLERVKTRVDYPLAAADDDDVVDEDVGEEQRQAVLDVYAEMQDRRAYWKKVALEGNRTGHYREEHVESTLVAFLDDNAPGRYEWIGRPHLHLTIRSLGQLS
ncbi:unnamed protein product (mitochondrion) [Plasmodiophora brassicae]|uniref:Uncharacterized protein n=1 Tax=Plasmodiophora brassicae TaxID=37360 RepID=A0A3P3YGL0_PLABS|nr:unnamed protein product [Plasmodiophora brassicae]